MSLKAPRDRPRPHQCEECGTRRGLGVFEVTQHSTETRRRPTRDPLKRKIRLCGECLRDRSATWRWTWKLAGRELPDREDRAA